MKRKQCIYLLICTNLISNISPHSSILKGMYPCKMMCLHTMSYNIIIRTGGVYLYEYTKPEPTPVIPNGLVNDRFGLFIHWGLYALPARHEWVKSVKN